MSIERRKSNRRDISPIEVSQVSSLDNLAKISRGGRVVDASINGFLLELQRDELVPKALRDTLTLDSLIGTRIYLHLSPMDLEISGKISRTKLVGNKTFEIAIDFSEDAPEYWRECLIDLLPEPGEFD